MSGNWIKAVVVMTCLGVGAAAPARAEPDQAMARLFEAQQRIAEKGEPEALFHLAEMYEQGLGTPRDMNKAHGYYTKAAERGHAGAKAKLVRWDQLAEEQRIAEQNRAREREEARAAEQERAKLAAAKAAAERERAAEAAKTRESARQAQRTKEQAEAEAAKQKAAAKAAEQKRAAEASKAASAAGSQKPAPAPAANPQEDDKSFSSNPCKGPTARFLSTCQ